MRHSGFDSYPGSGIRQNLGKGCRIGKENDIRDSGDRSSARGILVKKGRECGISTLPISRPYEGRMKHTSYLDRIRPLARFRWSLSMVAPRFEVHSVCIMIYGFMTLERPYQGTSLKLYSFKGIESFKKQNGNWRRRTAYRYRIANETFNEYILIPVCSFHLSWSFVLGC